MSPYVQSLGVLRGGQSGSANYTAMPLGMCAIFNHLSEAIPSTFFLHLAVLNLIADFTGPINLRGIPVFTHTNGLVTRTVIEVTWDAVDAQVQSCNKGFC